VNVEKSSRDMHTPYDQVSTTLGTATIACIECRRPWVKHRERWRLKVTDDAVPVTVPYCPDCATREFGAA
jgi:hypothetical protein